MSRFETLPVAPGQPLPVTTFLKPVPRFVPATLWYWLAGRFFFVDADGNEHLKPTPWWIAYRPWRRLGRLFFTIDVHKHRDFQRSAPAVLKEVLAIAPDAWLFAGAMLGCIREGRIIPWDRDVDLGIPSGLVTEELLDRFRAAGFAIERAYRYDLPVYREYVPDAMGQYSKVVLRKDAKIELCCFARGKDGRLYFGRGKTQLFGVDYELVYPLKQVPFYDFMANVPERVEDHLAYVYGPDWRVPKPAWIRSPEHEERRARFYVQLGERRQP